MRRPIKVIISGGGTGGHIYPAIAIANEIKERHPDSIILFVGAENRMEMTRVPEAGYEIVGLPISGYDRKNIIRNLSVLKKLAISLLRSNRIINKFKPDIVIGVGGYASGPILKIASMKKIPTLIQEQNSYAGMTNKFLAKKVSKICVAYEGLEHVFPKNKIVITGNPCRKELLNEVSSVDAYEYFKLDPIKKTILVLGGSLGSKTINQSILKKMLLLGESNVQILWQSGKRYYYDLTVSILNKENSKDIFLFDFITRMDYAYTVADLVISRAGASSISELSLLGKPTILVPSPNVAEDHQAKNAMALVNKNAAIMIKDEEAIEILLETALKVVQDPSTLSMLSINIKKLAFPDATKHIVDEVEKLI